MLVDNPVIDKMSASELINYIDILEELEQEDFREIETLSSMNIHLKSLLDLERSSSNQKIISKQLCQRRDEYIEAMGEKYNGKE